MKANKKFYLITVALLFSIISIGYASNDKNTEQKPNILFIMLDDLGKEWIGAYGAEDVKTPTIDKLASTGILFENVYSMPQCTPSRVTLLTGQYPYQHGWVNHFDVPRWGHGGRFDPVKNPSYPKYLQAAGYKTCIAGKWQINDFRLEPTILNEVGFDEYCMWTGAEGGNLEKSKKRYWDPYIHTKEGSKTYEGQFSEDIFSDFIIDFMKKNKENPMMIYYPMCLPHSPKTATPAEPNAPTKDKFKAMVRYTDIILAKLIKALDELELRENTIIFWTTDNGTSNGIIGHRNGKPVKGGKAYLTENGINAPFIVNCPGIVPEGLVNNELIDFTDILPTFCELAGAKAPAEFTYNGHSFAPIVLGEKTVSERNWILGMGSNPARVKNGKIATAFDYRDRVVRNKNHKAFIDTTGVIYEMIDLKNDFYEQNNLIKSSNSEIVNSKKEFQKVVNEFPEKDNYPVYTKGDNSSFEVPIEEILKKCLKGKAKGNKTVPFD